jgi:XTP/dITP diphosphohydrolase
MTRVLIATGNRGKIAEIQAMLGDAAEAVPLSVLGLEGAEETGSTFEENAILKARQGATESGLVTVADDSGIEVDALHGAPGVRSARYAGEPSDDERNRLKLLRELENNEDRSARFVCVIAVAAPDGSVKTFRGTLDGVVTRAPRGSGGFGYDSLLELPDGRTAAELSSAEKNAISHRGTALRNALPYLHELLVSMAATPEG